ncbi:hypothetical protein FDP22_09415 [Paroceanicella profunda]|uniref:Uncharacterized protein n=1 Tax=Paroceanicella profunda TaxID=2579971 RepID=A0A5B8FWP9_9RHOB|nr:hypothetical protein [Paroceanicella profunda]QDL91974.1 hypothetical protein FDP22_09415 [Paroceanicella profunda]
MSFDIRKSGKGGLSSPEHFIVTRDGNVFLRLLGEEPDYEIMTATASEDGGGLVRVADQVRLVEAALRTGKQVFGVRSFVEEDHKGREYAKICRLEYLSDAYRVAERFFEIYDGIGQGAGRPRSDLAAVYAELAVDDTGGDVYLSDGVWLGRDGAVTDRGR